LGFAASALGSLGLLALTAVWTRGPNSGSGSGAGGDAAPGGADSETWHRVLDVPLTGRRQALLQQIIVSSREVQADVHLLPFESLKPAARQVVEQQQKLIPEIQHNLHLAEWLERRVNDLERRAAGGPEPVPPRRQASLMGIEVELEADPAAATPPLAPIPLEPEVQARLAEIRERVARMDAEAERVARLLIECEANLLATISEQDEHRLGELFAEFAAIFGMHYAAAREVNERMRGDAPGA
jgi:hypothetical protein